MKLKDKKYTDIIIPILLLLIVLGAAIYATAMNWQVAVSRMEQSLGDQVKNQSSHLRDKVNGKASLLKGLSATFTQEDVSSQYFIMKKLRRCTYQTDFSKISYIYSDGTLQRNDGKKTNVSDRQYFKMAMLGNTKIEVIVSKIDGEKKIGIATPVVIDNKVMGVLFATYDMETFRPLIEESISDISNLSYICDTNGKYIIGTENAEIIMENYDPGITTTGGFFDILDDSDFSEGSKEEIVTKMQNGESGQAAYTYHGDKRYTTYEPLGINGWYVIAVLPESKIYEEAMESAKIAYVMLAAVMAVVIMIIMYLIWRERRLVMSEKRKADEIRYLLEHDDLTGILAEKTFYKQVQERLTKAKPGEYCIVYLDVYKFKLINEIFGYDKGDELLCAIGEELEQLTEGCNGLCGRISGDKFALFIPHQEELIKLFYTRKKRKKRILPIEIYLYYGVYVVNHMDIPPAQMVDCAQLAQRAIKGNYDNYVSYYNEKIKDQIMKEQEIISSMSKALDNGEFVVYLQPQYNYREGRICGSEALVRWKSPEKGLIPPGDFIPVFESNGFIIKLDENVWEQVCKLQRKWLDAGYDPLPISVNVSRADLLKGCVAEKIMGLIEKYDLTSDLIRVEVTESAYMDNPQQLIMEIDILRNNGLLVEMDDFGSGYSSLNMLKDVPIQVLKTDLKFLAGTGIEMRKESILANVVRMAHQMGMSVIAEGVETKEQADYLLQLNCEQMQGYYFSRPIPVEEFEKLVYHV